MHLFLAKKMLRCFHTPTFIVEPKNNAWPKSQALFLLPFKNVLPLVLIVDGVLYLAQQLKEMCLHRQSIPYK